MHRPRIGFSSSRWVFVKEVHSPVCERRQSQESPAGEFVCQVAGCHAPAHPVYQEAGGAISGWLCEEHVATAGYCNHCGVYVADKPEERTTWAHYGRCQACTETLFL